VETSCDVHKKVRLPLLGDHAEQEQRVQFFWSKSVVVRIYYRRAAVSVVRVKNLYSHRVFRHPDDDACSSRCGKVVASKNLEIKAERPSLGCILHVIRC
jgi:hypothetical protein